MTADQTDDWTDDLTAALSCAANLLLIDEDPGPRATNIGSASNPTSWIAG